ncbi:MAG TPA: MoxR family ATPase [Actinomycetes bacterium]|nr:MoxR family ATPase [Actinomycetes bacterium]
MTVTQESDLHTQATLLVSNIRRVVKGHDWAVHMLCSAALAGGHALLEDLPGTGKTTMARAFARSVGGEFQRVQGTADLLPSDITGSNIWDQSHGAFTFVPGPVFCNVLLVDEINRTPPRTQSAFLEVMEEGAVTIDGTRHDVPTPFFLMATQNPAEQYGTYPLPESQLDRFSVKVRLGAIETADEIQVVRDQLFAATVDDLQPVVSIAEFAQLRAAVRRVHIADSLMEYIVALVRSTRGDARLGFGASSRAAITLARLAQAYAVIGGRDYVGPGDVKAVASPVLSHRVNVVGAGVNADSVIADLVERAPVPVHT